MHREAHGKPTNRPDKREVTIKENQGRKVTSKHFTADKENGNSPGKQRQKKQNKENKTRNLPLALRVGTPFSKSD